MAVGECWMERRSRLGIRTRPLYCTLTGSPLDASYVRPMLTRLADRAPASRSACTLTGSGTAMPPS
jgi:hypothetical protein